MISTKLRHKWRMSMTPRRMPTRTGTALPMPMLPTGCITSHFGRCCKNGGREGKRVSRLTPLPCPRHGHGHRHGHAGPTVDDILEFNREYTISGATSIEMRCEGDWQEMCEAIPLADVGTEAVELSLPYQTKAEADDPKKAPLERNVLVTATPAPKPFTHTRILTIRSACVAKNCTNQVLVVTRDSAGPYLSDSFVLTLGLNKKATPVLGKDFIPTCKIRELVPGTEAPICDDACPKGAASAFRVAICSEFGGRPLQWSSAVALPNAPGEVRITLPASEDGDNPIYLTVAVPATGVVVFKEALAAPYRVLNETDSVLEFKADCKSEECVACCEQRNRWVSLQPSSAASIWCAAVNDSKTGRNELQISVRCATGSTREQTSTVDVVGKLPDWVKRPTILYSSCKFVHLISRLVWESGLAGNG